MNETMAARELIKIAKMISAYWRMHPGFIITPGVRDFCEEHQCYWMLDVIFSYQGKAKRDPMMVDFQIWEFKKPSPGASRITAIGLRDTGNVAFRQNIPYTDFDMDYIKFYVERGESGMVVMFPEER